MIKTITLILGEVLKVQKYNLLKTTLFCEIHSFIEGSKWKVVYYGLHRLITFSKQIKQEVSLQEVCKEETLR